MDELRALLRAALDEPLPRWLGSTRLVLADWLEEHGDPRADAVRGMSRASLGDSLDAPLPWHGPGRAWITRYLVVGLHGAGRRSRPHGSVPGDESPVAVSYHRPDGACICQHVQHPRAGFYARMARGAEILIVPGDFLRLHRQGRAADVAVRFKANTPGGRLRLTARVDEWAYEHECRRRTLALFPEFGLVAPGPWEVRHYPGGAPWTARP